MTLAHGQIYQSGTSLRRIVAFDEKTVIYDFKRIEEFDFIISNCTTSILEFEELAGKLVSR